MKGPLLQAIIFAVHFFFGLYILAVMLRFIMQVVRASFYNPIAQFLVTVTNPPLKPLRRIIPGLGGIDMASVLLLLVLQALEIILVGLVLGMPPNPAGLIILTIAKLIKLTFYIFLVLIVVRIIISWVSPQSYYGGHNPGMDIVVSLTEPILRPARKLIPPISGLDLSPIAVFFAFGILQILIIYPLIALGHTLYGYPPGFAP